MHPSRRSSALAAALLVFATLAAPASLRANEPSHATSEEPAETAAPAERPAETAAPADSPAESPAESPATGHGESGEATESAAPVASGAEPVTRVDAEVAGRLARAVNAARKASGLSAVAIDAERLQLVAAARALDMVRTRTLSPARTAAGESVEDLTTAVGVRWTAGGEAVSWAVGEENEDAVNGLLVGLLASPGSRRLVMARDATWMGVSVAYLDGGDGVRLPGRSGRMVPASPRLAVASLILVVKDGPASPAMSVHPNSGRLASFDSTIRVEPDGGGALSVVITNVGGDLLEVIAWNVPTDKAVTYHWDGTIRGTLAEPGAYQVRAWTVEDGIASDPAVEDVTVLP